jgi:hypothetical protein
MDYAAGISAVKAPPLRAGPESLPGAGRRSVRALILALLVAAACAEGRGEPGDPSPTNLTVFQRLAASMVDTLAPALARAEGGSIRLRVLPEETAWALELDIAQALRRMTDRTVEAGGLPTLTVDAGIVRGFVEYSAPRRDGLFGSKVADRSVLLTLRLKAWVPATGASLFAGEVTRVAHDTVGVAELERLETPGLEMTRGIPPPEGLFSSLLEPIILIGAIAVGVYLLFTVRS